MRDKNLPLPAKTEEDFERWSAAWDRDQKRRWWQAKECPNTLFEKAPLLFVGVGLLWLVTALSPLILGLVKP